MKEKELTELTDQELLEKRKKAKSTNISTAVYLGLMIGIAIYSTVKNGFGIFTFLPLGFTIMAAINTKNFKAIQNEIKSRNLQ